MKNNIKDKSKKIALVFLLLLILVAIGIWVGYIITRDIAIAIITFILTILLTV